MVGATSSGKGVLADLPTPILPKIGGETTREGLIKIHKLINGNVASVTSNIGGIQHRHLALTITSKEYTEQTGFAFVTSLNLSDDTQRMWSAQEKNLELKRFDKTK